MHSPAMRKSRPSWPKCGLATAPGESQGLGGHSTALARAQGQGLVSGCLGGTHCAAMVVGMPRTQVMEQYMSQGAKLRNVEQAPHNAVCKLSERLSGKNNRWHERARRSEAELYAQEHHQPTCPSKGRKYLWSEQGQGSQKNSKKNKQSLAARALFCAGAAAAGSGLRGGPGPCSAAGSCPAAGQGARATVRASASLPDLMHPLHLLPGWLGARSQRAGPAPPPHPGALHLLHFSAGWVTDSPSSSSACAPAQSSHPVTGKSPVALGPHWSLLSRDLAGTSMPCTSSWGTAWVCHPREQTFRQAGIASAGAHRPPTTPPSGPGGLQLSLLIFMLYQAPFF
ncbi:uncharacterized protein LOC123652517 isoform X2 [Pipistrellus kuhlii]|uniref:uncharacterized protein LOC123652517 isoform X2 n=1 Tax=Pipistrellus kuhlii TaxID=59472 RepID=UPI001E274550|nr:uncharacterized protein LOC123652517 isoform X2 [Pipistrellus kuhlii]